MGWMQSNDRTTGGRSLPPCKGFCAKCLRKRSITEMVIETNDRSDAFGYYVCAGGYDVGGCYDGPYPDGADSPNPGGDDLSPVPNLMHLGRGD